MIRAWSWVAGTGGGGGGGNAFGIIQPPSGTSPTASTSSDTLNLTSSDSTVTITGNSGTKTIDFVVPANTTNQKVQVAKNSGAVVGTRKQINFIEGSNVTLTVADDGGGDRVNVTVAATGSTGYTTVQEEGTPVTQRATINFIGTGITAADDAGNTRTNVTLSTILNSINDLSSTGVIARTGAGTVSARTITGTANRITVTNGDGVSGNPTLDVGTNVTVLGNTTTGSGSIVLATSPTLVTPTLGVSTATSINGLTITTTTGTLTMTNAKTLSVTNSLTLSGTDATVQTFPTTSQTIAGLTETQTFTNKRITKRVTTVSDATSISANGDTTDIVVQPNTQAVGTLTINSPSGTPTDGQALVFRIKSTNVQTFSWNAIFRGSTTTALATSSSGSSKTDYYCFMYNAADTKWDFTGSNKGF